MNVLVVPEHPRNDQYILKPLFSRLFSEAGFAAPQVEVCQDPVLGGVNEALKPERIEKIINRYKGMVKIFILCVDRDGDPSRRARLDSIEKRFGAGRVFLAENAWEEIETWALAGLVLPKNWKWADVRAEIDVKGRYFDELARKRGVADEPGGGRRTLGREAARSIRDIRRKCPEDFGVFARRVEAAAP